VVQFNPQCAAFANLDREVQALVLLTEVI
jgi:hypothetical protein